MPLRVVAPVAFRLGFMFRLASRFSLLPSILIAALAGAGAVLAFAPFSWQVLAILALTAFYQALRGHTGRGAFLVGWAFGLGLMGFGVFWIRVSLDQFGNMDAWAAHALTVLFIAAMALYYGLAAWLIQRLERGPPWAGPLLALPGAWVLLEWLRGWLLTGFPWLAVGYSQIDSPLAGFAPVGGVYAVSLVVALAAGLLWGVANWSGRSRWFALVGLLALALVALGLRQVTWTQPDGEMLRASVLQANVPQEIKWDPESKVPTVQAYLDMTLEHLASDVLVWPETALPDFLDRVREPLLDPLGERLREIETGLVLGIPVRDGNSGAFYNAMLSIGAVEDIYYKRHLVPFGEFLPFKRWLGPIVDWFELPISDFSRGRMQRPLLRVNGHQVGASVCYEDAFPIEVAEALPEAAYLINVSNDGWFGDSLAPHQHLEIARMRALENGRYLLRATNTGVSAIIDHRGGILGMVPAHERGVFSAAIQPRRGATPFTRLGNGLVIALALLLIASAAALAPQRRQH